MAMIDVQRICDILEVSSNGVTLDTSTDKLGVPRRIVMELLAERFPKLSGMENTTPLERDTIFTAGFDHVVSREQRSTDTIDFGEPWTIRRFQALYHQCMERAHPETGGG